MQIGEGEGEPGMESHPSMAFWPWFGMNIITCPLTPRNVLYKMLEAYNDFIPNHSWKATGGVIPYQALPLLRLSAYNSRACEKLKRRARMYVIEEERESLGT